MAVGSWTSSKSSTKMATRSLTLNSLTLSKWYLLTYLAFLWWCMYVLCKKKGCWNNNQRIERNAGWFIPPLRSSVGVMPSDEYTTIELAGTDRPGLLSEVSAVLTDLHCNVVNAEIWTHNTRAAAVIHVTDNTTNSAITDPIRLSTIKHLLCNVVRTNSGSRAAKTVFSSSDTHRERRLHQIMFDDRDYEGAKRPRTSRPCVTLTNIDKDYTVVTMRSRDRPKLVFDVVCTLTDMQYVVFHGMVSTEPLVAYQVFYAPFFFVNGFDM